MYSSRAPAILLLNSSATDGGVAGLLIAALVFEPERIKP
jgi:hypothetical protein